MTPRIPGRTPNALVLLVAVVAAGLAAIPAAGQDVLAYAKPEVEVRFLLSETSYREYYTDAEIEGIESRSVANIRDILGRVYRFVDFVDTNAANRLEVKLGLTRPERAVARGYSADHAGAIPGVWPVHLRITLTGHEVFGLQSGVSWCFRPADRSADPLPSAERLITSIRDFFAWRLQPETAPVGADRGSGAATRELVDGVFRTLLLTKDAYPLQATPAWLLPFSMQDWGIGRTSEFKVIAEVRIGSVPDRAEYRVKVSRRYDAPDSTLPDPYRHDATLADLVSTDEEVERLRSAETVDGLAVLLVDFVAPQGELPLLSPFDLINEEDEP